MHRFIFKFACVNHENKHIKTSVYLFRGYSTLECNKHKKEIFQYIRLRFHSKPNANAK